MPKASFCTPVLYATLQNKKERFFQTGENFFHWGCREVYRVSKDSFVMQKHKQHVLMTILKVMACFTLLVPLFFLCVKALHRNGYLNKVRFDKAQTDSKKSFERVPNEPRPEERGMILGEFSTSPKFGVELPGPLDEIVPGLGTKRKSEKDVVEILQDPFELVPNEIVHHIFTFLDLKTIGTASQVCRLFHAEANVLEFVKASLVKALTQFVERIVLGPGLTDEVLYHLAKMYAVLGVKLEDNEVFKQTESRFNFPSLDLLKITDPARALAMKEEIHMGCKRESDRISIAYEIGKLQIKVYPQEEHGIFEYLNWYLNTYGEHAQYFLLVKCKLGQLHARINPDAARQTLDEINELYERKKDPDILIEKAKLEIKLNLKEEALRTLEALIGTEKTPELASVIHLQCKISKEAAENALDKYEQQIARSFVRNIALFVDIIIEVAMVAPEKTEELLSKLKTKNDVFIRKSQRLIVDALLALSSGSEDLEKYIKLVRDWRKNWLKTDEMDFNPSALSMIKIFTALINKLLQPKA